MNVDNVDMHDIDSSLKHVFGAWKRVSYLNLCAQRGQDAPCVGFPRHFPLMNRNQRQRQKQKENNSCQQLSSNTNLKLKIIVPLIDLWQQCVLPAIPFKKDRAQ